jgi:hypothetical protein
MIYSSRWVINAADPRLYLKPWRAYKSKQDPDGSGEPLRPWWAFESLAGLLNQNQNQGVVRVGPGGAIWGGRSRDALPVLCAAGAVTCLKSKTSFAVSLNRTAYCVLRESRTGLDIIQEDQSGAPGCICFFRIAKKMQ